jgi:hypothetical protein
MQLCRIICSLTALHVSSDIFAHHQEHLNCICSFWYYSRMSWPAGVMDELELRSKSSFNKLFYSVAPCWSFSWFNSCSWPDVCLILHIQLNVLLSILYVLLTLHLGIIVWRKTNLTHKLFLAYFVNLCMFRAYLGPSSEGTTVCIQQLVLCYSC